MFRSRGLSHVVLLSLVGMPLWSAGCSNASDAAFDHRDAGALEDAVTDASADDAVRDGFTNDGGVDATSDAPDEGSAHKGLFDLVSIRDASTANCTLTNKHIAVKDGVALDVWNISYASWESVDGTLRPILIRGFVARPSGGNGGVLPGVVQAHGLGGFAQESHATGLAALLGTYALAYTGPGGGTEPSNTSEGKPSADANGYRMFDTLKDVRGSWFWAHTVAGLRGLTCLETLPDVDPRRLGMTGFSAGGVATLMGSGADDRILAAVPLSGTGAWSIATQSPTAWQHALLTKAGLTTQSPEWTTLQERLIDPVPFVGSSSAKILMVNGSTDEFFPLPAHIATFNAIPGTGKRTSIAGNFDHGCYKVSGVESASTIEDRASIHAAGGQRAWFRHWFATDANYAHLPDAPGLRLTPMGDVTSVQATVDTAGPLVVEEVKFWWSNDDSFVYGNVALDAKGGGRYEKLVPVPLQPNTVSYVDVQYKTTNNLISPERFAISSLPTFPSTVVPHIRSVTNCL